MNFLSREEIKLRALEPDDVDFLYELENQEGLWEVSQTQIPFSKFLLSEYIKNAKQDIYEAKQFRYVICSSDNQVFGCIDLYDFDPKNKRACIGITILEKYRGLGIGQKALQNLVSYSKKYFDLYQLIAYIPQDNVVSISLFEKLGFVCHGVKKDWIFSQGVFKDVLIYQKKL